MGPCTNGLGLPGAIGAAMANKNKRVICLTGDGGLLMNIQELMHISEYKLNIIVILFNNNGYATIEKTTKRYHGKCIASNKTNGIVNPNFEKICDAYNLNW